MPSYLLCPNLPDGLRPPAEHGARDWVHCEDPAPVTEQDTDICYARDSEDDVIPISYYPHIQEAAWKAARLEQGLCQVTWVPSRIQVRRVPLSRTSQDDWRSQAGASG